MEPKFAAGQRSSFVEQIKLVDDMIGDIRSQANGNDELAEQRRPDIDAATRRVEAAVAAKLPPEPAR